MNMTEEWSVQFPTHPQVFVKIGVLLLCACIKLHVSPLAVGVSPLISSKNLHLELGHTLYLFG